MDRKQPTNQSIDDLTEEWREKLRDSGFRDIEDKNGNLSTWHSYKLCDRDRKYDCLHKSLRRAGIKLRIAQNSEYYRLASHFLHDHPFNSGLEKLIWKLHSDGVSLFDVSQRLGKKGVTLRMARNTIERLSRLMKERYLKP